MLKTSAKHESESPNGSPICGVEIAIFYLNLDSSLGDRFRRYLNIDLTHLPVFWQTYLTDEFLMVNGLLGPIIFT